MKEKVEVHIYWRDLYDWFATPDNALLNSALDRLRKQLQEEWNRHYAPPRLKFDSFKFEFDKHRHWEKYLQLKEFLLEKAGEYIEKIECSVHYQWEEEELLRAELLLFLFVRGNYVEEEEMVFEYQNPCLSCGFPGRAVQIKPLWIKRIRKRKDFCWVYSAFENSPKELADPELYIVSNRVKELFQQWKISGCDFQPVYVGRKRLLTNEVWQWVAISKIEPLLCPPTKVSFSHQCKVCGFYKEDLNTKVVHTYVEREGIEEWHIPPILHFPREAWQGEDVCYYEWPTWSQRKDYLISQKVYRLLKEHNIRDYFVDPVFLV